MNYYKIVNKLKQFTVLLLLTILQTIPANTYSLSPYTTDELEELEKEFIQQINQSDNIVRNPLASQYINHLGKQLAQFAKLPTPYFFIVRSNEINAFAGPGGYIGINSELILVTDNESELAAVMAHELAHVRLHHLYSMIEHQKQMRIPMLAALLASVALGTINPTLGSGAMIASMTGFAENTINFTRAKEKEADRIGINMLIRAGFNPQGMISFFKKMQQNSRYYYTANIPAILRTHPLDEERIAEAENRSQHISNKHFPDAINYRLFKEMIRTLATSNNKQLVEYYQNQCQSHHCKANCQSACQYGYGMVLTNLNQFKQAGIRFALLLNENPTNLFFQIAMAYTELGEKRFDAVLKRLQGIHANYPDNYAVLMAYAESLLVSGYADKAVSILLKGSRQFKYDLALCQQLAQAQSTANRKAYAYFTESQCKLLEGYNREALRQLRLVKTMAKQDHYLLARTQAMIDEIIFTQSMH